MKRLVFIGLNGVALAIFGNLLWQVLRSPTTLLFNNPLFVLSGFWAIRFLLISLAITPLNSLLGWRWAIPYRKPAGLWAYAFGLLHVSIYIQSERERFEWSWLLNTPYLLLGVITITILTLLALTSHRLAMRRLGKWWKRLHRLVYIANLTAVIHGLLALSSSKTGGLSPWLMTEVQFYLALVILLLALRFPMIRGSGVRVFRNLRGYALGRSSLFL